MGKLVGYAERSWVDKKTGELKERVVIWISKTVEGMCGEAFEEVMVRDDQLPPDFALGDDLIALRDNRGFVQEVIRLGGAKSKA